MSNCIVEPDAAETKGSVIVAMPVLGSISVLLFVTVPSNPLTLWLTAFQSLSTAQSKPRLRSLVRETSIALTCNSTW